MKKKKNRFPISPFCYFPPKKVQDGAQASKKGKFYRQRNRVLLEEIFVEYALFVSKLKNNVIVNKKREVCGHITQKAKAYSI